MKDSDNKRKLAYEVIIFLAMLALLMFITRIWAILFLVILGIFIAALVLLFRRSNRVEIIVPATESQTLLKPETEKDILRRAFGLIQRRITEDVEALHPHARWQWLTPNAMGSIDRDEPVTIILDGAAGYRKASVQIHNLTFKGLVYEVTQTEAFADTVENAVAPSNISDKKSLVSESAPEDNEIDCSDEPDVMNYEYLAFEWVDSHLLLLNNRSNEALARHENTLLIPENELPVKESWSDICHQLIDNDFADAVALGDGIRVSLTQ